MSIDCQTASFLDHEDFKADARLNHTSSLKKQKGTKKWGNTLGPIVATIKQRVFIGPALNIRKEIGFCHLGRTDHCRNQLIACTPYKQNTVPALVPLRVSEADRFSGCYPVLQVVEDRLDGVSVPR
jgi:hypothetical protein